MVGQMIKGNPDIPQARRSAFEGLALRSFLVAAMFGSSADYILGWVQPTLNALSKLGIGDEMENLNDKVDRGIHDFIKDKGGDEVAAKFFVNTYHTSLLTTTSKYLSEKAGVSLPINLTTTENPLLSIADPQAIDMVMKFGENFGKEISKIYKTGAEGNWGNLGLILGKLAANNINTTASRLVKSAYEASTGKTLDANLESTERPYNAADLLRDNLMMRDPDRTREAQTDFENKYKAYSNSQIRDTYWEILNTPGISYGGKKKHKGDFVDEYMKEGIGKEDIDKLYYGIHDDFVNEIQEDKEVLDQFNDILGNKEESIEQRVNHISKKLNLAGVTVDPKDVKRTNKELNQEEETLAKNIQKYIKADVTAKALSEYTGTTIVNSLDDEMTFDPEEINSSVQFKAEKIKNKGTRQQRALAYAKTMLYKYLFGSPKKSKAYKDN
jgi:hypothetical protein